MARYSAKHGGTRIMHVAAQELTAKWNFLFCGCDPAQRKSFPWFETGSGKTHWLIKTCICILIQGLSTQCFHNLSHKNKIIIAVYIFPCRSEFTGEYAVIHRVFPVSPDI